jgi:hypothetical protein
MTQYELETEATTKTVKFIHPVKNVMLQGQQAFKTFLAPK